MSFTSPQFSRDAPSPTPGTPERTGYPFPAQAWPRRQSSAQHLRPRRGSAASSVSAGSIGGSLDISSLGGSTVRETSHNAISTLLQPPIVRTGLLPHTAGSAAAAGYKAPTTKDIPPVTLTNLPHVPPDNLRNYLSRIGPLFESIQRGRADSEQAGWPPKDKEQDRSDRLPRKADRSPSVDGSATPLSPRSSPYRGPSPLEKPGVPRRRSSGQFRRNRNEPTPLSTIPNVYFDEDFHLENPRIFDVVSERAEIVRTPQATSQADQSAGNGTPLPPRKALATNAILQEKLSWYMDTIEVHLINNISTASTGFFAALGSLKELQTEAEESVAKIQNLRQDLQRLDQELAVGGLEVAAKRRRMANLQKLGRATAQAQDVVEQVKKADRLVDEENYDQAADQMDDIGRRICGIARPNEDGSHLIDLRPLTALQGLDSGLQELQLRIGTGFARRFTSILKDDLHQHLEKVPQNEILKRWSRQRGIAPIYMETSDQFRMALKSSLEGLDRAGHLAPATAAYREVTQKEMKSLIRKHLPSSSDDDTESMVSISTRGGNKLSQQEKSSILARNLRALDEDDAEKLLVNVYTSVGEALRRVSTQTKILLDLTSSMDMIGAKSPTGAPSAASPSSADVQKANGSPILPTKASLQDELSQALDTSSLLGQAVDTAQTQITRVLKVRNEQSIKLSKERFLRYFTLNRLFADECEAVSGRGGQALRGIINAQITGFVQALGTGETERVAKLLDNDSWNAVDFTDNDNALLQRILGSMSSDPPEWTRSTPIWEPTTSSSDTPQPDGPTTTNGSSTPNGQGASKTATKPAYVDDHRFILVQSVIALLAPIDSLLSLTASIPSVTPHISTSLLEVLRTFNSRSCQLILGAGATRSAGLKNITTKHLALASQALSFIVALVPYIRECARRHLPSGQTSVLAEFDKTKRLYQDHQSGIHDKLVEIMTTRSQAHVKTMSSMDFDAAASDEKPSAYMETLTKETLTLHRVLARHLAETDIFIIMRQIFDSYKEQWTKAFSEVEIKTEEGSKRLLKDAECFESRLGKIDGFGDIGKEVVGVVKTMSHEAQGKNEESKQG